MFNKTKLLLSFLFSACLSSFAPGPEMGYFNKATQLNKYAYYGAQQFYSYRFASSGIRRASYFNQQSNRQLYNQAISSYMLWQNREAVGDISLPGVINVLGDLGIPLMIIGGAAGTFFLAKKFEQEKQSVKNYSDNEKRLVTELEELLAKTDDKKISEERKKELEKLRKELDFIKSSEAVTRLLLDDNRYNDLIRLLSRNDKEIEEELLGSRKRQREEIDKIYKSLRTMPLDISSISTDSKAKRGLKLNWLEKRPSIVSAMEDQQKDLASLLCALRTLKSNEIDKLNSCFEHVSISNSGEMK